MLLLFKKKIFLAANYNLLKPPVQQQSDLEREHSTRSQLCFAAHTCTDKKQASRRKEQSE